MKVLIIMLGLLVTIHSSHSRDLKVSAQARLLKLLVEKSNQLKPGKVQIAIVGSKEDEFTRDLMESFLKLKKLKIDGKSANLNVKLYSVTDPGIQKADVIYLVGEQDLDLPGKITFSNRKSMAEKGVLVALTMEGTTPRVYMNLKSMKQLGISYPTKLMKMITILK